MFYSYLSDRIINHFKNNNPGAGDKFSVSFENDAQVKELYEELRDNTLSRSFSYIDNGRAQKYETYELNFGEIQLIVAASIDNYPHPDFLANLRNLVGKEEGYKNKAILFVHSSTLDSIVGGAGALSKDGMPLNILSIEKDIKARIVENGYSKVDVAILENYLANKKRELDGSTATLFEYEEIIECLGDSQITYDEYCKFELFPDDKLSQFSGKDLRERLEDNHYHYVNVAEMHSYGIDEQRLEKTYGEEGVKALKSTDWKSIQYSTIRKYIDDKKNASTIEYIPIESNFLIWDREEGTSKTKSRIRNILIFLSPTEVEYTLTLFFDDFTKKACIEVPKGFQKTTDCESSGKKLIVKLKDIEDKASFYRVKYNEDGARFDFKIAVLRCPQSMFESIKTQYCVDANAIRIVSDEDEICFNKNVGECRKVQLTENNQLIQIDEKESVLVGMGDEYLYSEDSDDVFFTISTETFAVPIVKTFAVEKPTVIEGIRAWYLKRTKRCSFEIIGENSLVLGTKKYWARDEFKKTLILEKKYLETGKPFVEENSEGELIPIIRNIPNEVIGAFDAIVKYYVQKNRLPSLSYIDDELKNLYANYLKSIIEAINSIPDGGYLSERNGDYGLFALGMIRRTYGDQEILLTPLHPINVAYQLLVLDQNVDGLAEDELDLMRKFQHTSLLPYINYDLYSNESREYSPVEQLHSPEWKIYVDDELPRYKGSKDFVSKLVADKIQEFVEHFNYLFTGSVTSPIRINLINTGDCREIVQGIMKYYIKEMRTTKSKQVIPIQVMMYSSSRLDTAFDMVSRVENTDVLIKSLGLDIKIDELTNDEVLDIYRGHVQFYYKNIHDDFEYSHITFVELDDDNQAITTNVGDLPSGIVMNGLSSGVPSERLGDSYRTGFGTKYIDCSSDLIDIAIKYNSLNAAMNGASYHCGTCCAVKMSTTNQKNLDKIYDASNWVTFINPKVDLNFFRNDVGAKDLLIIHYSDQYNLTSSGYDAITVTRKSKQYQNAIARYLDLNGVEDSQAHSKNIINMFNALNGDWLLRMLSYKSNFPVEKLSILSAVKFAVKKFASEGVVWIPVSLEEIFRVSGAVGLSRKNSPFSAKNLGFEGSTSDDLLLIGIKDGDIPKVTFYPIEVKIGKVPSDYLEKGIKQTTRTREIFDEILQKGECKGKDIKTRIYRNFFIQQAIVNAEKMIMYGIGDSSQGWEKVTSSDLRKKLLCEEYEIVESLMPKMGHAGVVSFREECVHERDFRNQNVLIIEKNKKSGVNLLALDFSDIDSLDWEVIEDQPLSQQVKTDEAVEENYAANDINEKVIDSSELTIVDNSLSSAIQTEHSTRVLIGKDQYKHDVYWEFGNKALANRHLLITGTSGQGKTYGIQTMLYELSKSNVSAVVFDYTEGFMVSQLEEPFKEALGDKLSQHIVYSSGVPINPFQRHELDLDGVKILEKESLVASRLADILTHVYDFGAQQYAAIFDAALNGMQKYGDRMNMRHFQEELELVSEENKTAKSVISKMSPFFHTVEFKNDFGFDWGNILYADDAKVNIIQLTLFTQEMKVIITELMLWDAWYYTKKFGTKDKPFVIVLDEAQNLSHTSKSPSAAILTEGRKFGWSAWFATQSLKVLKDDEVVRLLQSAFKLYFKPTDEEMVKISKQLDVTGGGNWLYEIQKLKKGQCIVVGDKMKPNGLVGPSAPVVTNITSFTERNN